MNFNKTLYKNCEVFLDVDLSGAQQLVQKAAGYIDRIPSKTSVIDVRQQLIQQLSEYVHVTNEGLQLSHIVLTEPVVETIVFVRFKQPVLLNDKDINKTKMLLCLISDKHYKLKALQRLSALGRLSKNRAFVKALEGISSKDDFSALLYTSLQERQKAA